MIWPTWPSFASITPFTSVLSSICPWGRPGSLIATCFPGSQILRRIEHLGELVPLAAGDHNGPAERYRFAGAKGEIGPHLCHEPPFLRPLQPPEADRQRQASHLPAVGRCHRCQEGAARRGNRSPAGRYLPGGRPPQTAPPTRWGPLPAVRSNRKCRKSAADRPWDLSPNRELPTCSAGPHHRIGSNPADREPATCRERSHRFLPSAKGL